MIFPYREITPKIFRPIIQVVLKNENKFAIYFVLVDSGADRCIFSIELAKALQIKLKPKKIILKGIAKEKIIGYSGKVEISIDGVSYDLTAIFADIGEFGHGILGQKGFFDHFDVKLSYQRKIIEITKSNSIN